MELFTEYQLDMLNTNTVSLVSNQFIDQNGTKIQVGQTSRTCYCNCPTHRQHLQELLPEEYYNAIVAIWGNTAIFEDLEHPKVD